MNINSTINNTYQNILNVITEAQLPVGTIYFMLKDILRDIEITYQASLQLENENIIEEQQDEKNNEEED